MNKITRKSFLKVLAATMVGGAAASALTGAAAPVSIDETNGKVSRWVKNNLNPDGPLTIAKQGMFSSGGTVTAPVAGTYDATTNWLDTTRAGNTAHVDHANVLYESYQNIVGGITPFHRKVIDSNDIKNFRDYRNKETHGNYNLLNMDIGITALHLAVTVYCSILHRSGVSDQILIELCKKRFFR